MAIREIVLEGDNILRKKCKLIDKFDERLAMILDDMADTLKKSEGIGLAAPQIGILRRYAIVDMSDNGSNIVEIINPKIIERSGKQEDLEGCLSCPNEYGITLRPQKVKVKAQDRYGKEFVVEAEGLTARAFCHEIDHLDGILFKDKAKKILTPEELEEYIKNKNNK